MTFTTRWGTEVRIENREKLLENNINHLLGEYENGMYDDPDNFPLMTVKEVIDYCIPDIYDMISDGHGYCGYKKGIAKELKFLGNDVIIGTIVKLATEYELLK